ncbi:MAG: site-2 protease family protein [Planctomycetota bacterium]|nr:site-2 protease family protein [Planctomycetota bacterium]
MGLYLIAFSWQALGDRAWQIGSVAAGLGLVIFVHELGHFLVAKWFGVKCEKFYVGFDVPIKIFGLRLPSKLIHFQWGETEYGVGIIPLGGYVKMLGQDDDPRAAQAEMERIRVKKSKDEGRSQTDRDATGASSADDSPEQAQALASETHPADQGEDAYELDPRSFPAKTVPQRMGIISAGVIMNLIFAVIFAACAFRAGVPYTPCEVGVVLPGSPAWTHGVEPGTRIVQVGNSEKRKSFLRFIWDLSNRVNMTDDGEALRLVTQDADKNERIYEIVPATIAIQGERQRLIGISPAFECQLHPKLPVLPESAAAATATKLVGGDRITAFNATRVGNGYELNTLLATHIDEPVTLTIERQEKDAARDAAPTIHEVKVEPNHIHRLGLVMQTGPIVGIRPGSPATEAGFELGDQIETIAGEPIGDPMSLPTQIRPYHDQEIDVQVRRGDEIVTLRVTPRTPKEFDWNLSTNSPMASLALGVAYRVGREVQSVVADSPADKAGIQPGDVAVAFDAVDDDAKPGRVKRLLRYLFGEPDNALQLDDENVGWPYVFAACQSMKKSFSLHLSMRRDGQLQEFALKPEATDELNPNRGLVLVSKTETYVAQSWSEAVSLGASRTWQDALHVTIFLKKLVTGRIALTNLGGPLVIATVAGSEASEGLPSLLIFLTFLSANLAVINFMPIPALDGGHFIFLLWEGISGKPVNERVQIALTLAGIGCLLCLMIFVVGLDINRLFF